LTTQEGADEENLHHVSEHLSACGACRRLHAASQTLADLLAEERRRLDKLVQHSRTSKSRVLAEISPLPAKRTWRLRAAWAGAALVVAALAVGLPLFLKGDGVKSRSLFPKSAPPVTQTLAATASSRTLQELAEVARRHKAPSFELPYEPPAFPTESLLPRFLQQCTLESEHTLGTIVQSKSKLTRREET